MRACSSANCPGSGGAAEGGPAQAARPGAGSRRRWTGGRIASLVIGSLLALMALGVLAVGGVATWADNTQRDANHAHSVWRDPSADFGMDVLAAHRAAHH